MKNENIITCFRCGAEIPLTEAMAHSVREQLWADFELEREQQLQKAVAYTAMLYGGIRGITGRDAFSVLKTLDLPSPSLEAAL